MKLTRISVRSSSIKYLTLEKITCDFRDLSHLFEYTPCLRRISIKLTYGFPNQEFHTPLFSIISLKILYHGCANILTNLFQNIPNLIYLTLETFDIYSDGYEWEKILRSYLPNIKVFQLKMNLNFPHRDNINKQVDDLLDTFRTSFWLEEHHWFVRCDWDPLNIFNDGILYTLPYAFDDCFYFDAVSSKSTCSNYTDYCSYDRVPILSHGNPENDSSKDSILCSFFKYSSSQNQFSIRRKFLVMSFIIKSINIDQCNIITYRCRLFSITRITESSMSSVFYKTILFK
jgi:hypothetical protein